MIVTPERAFKILSVMPATERTLTISDRGDRASDFRCLGLQWADIDLKEALFVKPCTQLRYAAHGEA
jgi:hypothetical protein